MVYFLGSTIIFKNSIEYDEAMFCIMWTLFGSFVAPVLGVFFYLVSVVMDSVRDYTWAVVFVPVYILAFMLSTCFCFFWTTF
ncbi:hypothetical protein Pelo_15824 [Pelomyxa schiedti]|nr:hypothetical protein Pelo_15824 [Pelomyxa schiedti]